MVSQTAEEYTDPRVPGMFMYLVTTICLNVWMSCDFSAAWSATPRGILDISNSAPRIIQENKHIAHSPHVFASREAQACLPPHAICMVMKQ